MSCQILNITSTCCTRHGWAWRGCWVFPRSSWFPWLYEEGVQVHPDHPASCWDRLKSISLWKIAYKRESCQFLINITGTYFICHSWACRGCEGVREHHDHLWWPFWIDLSLKTCISTCAISNFDGHKWYLVSSIWLSLTRSLRVSESILITLYHVGTVLNQFVFWK